MEFRLDNLFINYLHSAYRLEQSAAEKSLLIILLAFTLVIVLTTRKSVADTNKLPEFMSRQTSDTLKGLAIILLLIGHMCLHLIEGQQFFEYAGKWAVIIFLFISGVTLTKSYAFKPLSSVFLCKRIRRLLPSLWIALTLFYALEFLIANHTYPVVKIGLNYLGLLTPHSAPIPAAWFITYIFFLYGLFYGVGILTSSTPVRFFVMLALAIAAATLIAQIDVIKNYIGFWLQYTIVFPIAYGVGLYHAEMRGWFANLLQRSRYLYICCSLLLTAGFVLKWGLATLENVFPSLFVEILSPLPLMLAMVLWSLILDGLIWQSKFLAWLGAYAFEIYLLHSPFMVLYDFLLFRKPLFISFMVYFALMLVLALCLSKLTTKLNNRMFSHICG